MRNLGGFFNLRKFMSILFTSDTHFLHENIIRLSGRPYKTNEEMTESIISNWNNKVKPNDDVYHLGDFSFGNASDTLAIIKRLNGKIHFIKGNHDQVVMRNIEVLKSFVWVKDYFELRITKQLQISLFHYPINEWNKIHRGAWHLYGHVHGNNNIEGKALDVGLDGPLSNYTPLSFEEIEVFMEDRPILSHH
jgi:calcineurin-like phosphoesterase family protein